MRTSDIIDALDSVIWYNGLGEEVLKWIELEPDIHGTISHERAYKYPFEDDGDAQLQLIWMICVCLFGDYGSSPRVGWIEDIPGFRKFIKKICKSYLKQEELWIPEEKKKWLAQY